MAVKKNALGKGLDSLIADKVGTKNQTGFSNKERPEQMVNITKVEPNRDQPRKKFEEGALQELAQSIRQYGILQPLLVQDKKDYYEIIAGERRWRAAKIAGLKEVPVIVKSLSEQELLEISLIENIQRENLNPIEEAFAYKKLLEEFNLKQEEVADRVAKSRTAVTNSIRLLKLPEEIQRMLIENLISSGHARSLITLENTQKQLFAANKIIDEKLNVRDTEKLVRRLLQEMNSITEGKSEENSENFDFIFKDIEERMKQLLGTKVQIHQKNTGKGKIEIEYYSSDELNRLFEMLQTIEK